MFTTRRRPGDRIEIGPDVVVHVGEIDGGQVRLSIDAPPAVRITPVRREDAADRPGQGVRP